MCVCVCARARACVYVCVSERDRVSEATLGGVSARGTFREFHLPEVVDGGGVRLYVFV